MGILGVTVFIARGVGLGEFCGFFWGTSLIVAILSHDRFIERSYWDGMLLPVVLIGTFFTVGIALERHILPNNPFTFIFNILGFVSIFSFYIYRLLRRRP